jgi:hypothetical protein
MHEEWKFLPQKKNLYLEDINYKSTNPWTNMECKLLWLQYRLRKSYYLMSEWVLKVLWTIKPYHMWKTKSAQNIRDRGWQGGRDAALINIAKTELALLKEEDDQDRAWRLPMSSQMSITGCKKQW